MKREAQNELLKKIQQWFREVIAENHLRNTRRLTTAEHFNINPFLTPYLAVFLNGKLDAESVARALIYPRVLGSSVTTSFGQNIQRFITDVLGKAFGDTAGTVAQGVDIEFIDAIDGRKKYCQVKLGPNTINHDDVTTIVNHFSGVLNLSKTNSLPIAHIDMVVGVLYGEHEALSGHYQAIYNDHHYPVLVGKQFWWHLTGDERFYERLIQAITEVASEFDAKSVVEETVQSLAQTPEIQAIAKLKHLSKN